MSVLQFLTKIDRDLSILHYLIFMVKIQCTCSKNMFQYISIDSIPPLQDPRYNRIMRYGFSREYRDLLEDFQNVPPILLLLLTSHLPPSMLDRSLPSTSSNKEHLSDKFAALRAYIGMVEEVRVPSEPDGKDVVKMDKDGKDVVKEDDTQGPVKVRHDHPIFKSVDDGDMERLQNYLEVDSLKLHDQLNNRKMWQINEKGNFELPPIPSTEPK